CQCGFEGHADLTASETFLKRHTTKEVRPMARPVRFEWDDHNWSESPRSHRPKEQRTDPSTVHPGGNVASGES
ncbi:Neutral proteinase, partial [Halorhabdus tiamatea SARL4B]